MDKYKLDNPKSFTLQITVVILYACTINNIFIHPTYEIFFILEVLK